MPAARSSQDRSIVLSVIFGLLIGLIFALIQVLYQQGPLTIGRAIVILGALLLVFVTLWILIRRI